MFGPNQIRDLDIVGRENAEHSNDIKYLFSKGWLKEIRKDAFTSHGTPPDMSGVQKVVEEANKASLAATAATEALNTKLSMENEELRKKMSQMELSQKQSAEDGSKKMDQLLSLVKSFAEAHPAEARAAAAAMRNIQTEQKQIEEMSQAEIEAHGKILDMRKKNLKQNMENLGKTVAQSSGNVKEALDAMDQLDL
jgi:hypothetical protein